MAIPLIIELDEQLRDNEEMVGITNIIIDHQGSKLIGHLALIKQKDNHLNVRYGTLKAWLYDKKIGSVI